MEHPNYARDYSDIHKCLRFREEGHPRNRSEDKPLPFAESCVYCLKFSSGNDRYLIGHNSYRCEEHDEHFEGEPVEEGESDEKIEENKTFRYLLMRECPSSDPPRQHNRVTILLHGLNERTFLKYMPWAYHIWRSSETPVVLFPLSFSINRVLRDWAREVRSTYQRRQALPNNERSHRFNATISERLEPRPERFFWGAIQSYWDIVDFVRQIRGGKHEQLKKHFTQDAQVNFLGYSSGGYLALALLAINHEELFSESRASLFASCVEMDELRPASPYVVDGRAELFLRTLYVNRFGELPNERMKHWLNHHPEARWLSSFAGKPPDRAQREAHLRVLAPRIFGIANTNDQVMPRGAMLNGLQGIDRDTGVRVESLSLGIHECPFAFADYNQSDAEFILGTVNEQLYGSEFEQFIHWIVKHLE